MTAPPGLPSAAELAGRVAECVAALRAETALEPRVGVVLGSGLGGVADRIALAAPAGTAAAAVPGAASVLAAAVPRGAAFVTADLPHWPASTVHGHDGRLVLGWWQGTPVVVLRGRTHVYEGYPLDRVTFAHRVMHALGVTTMLVTNAVGTFNRSFAPGDLMLVRDHVNHIGRHGLFAAEEVAAVPAVTRGALGRRRPYTPEVLAVLRAMAREQRIVLREGVLLAGRGPAYESAAEIRMARLLGADAACMSSAHEVDLAAALGLRTGAVSCITNYGTGLSPHPLTHDEVQEVAGRVATRLETLLAAAVGRL